MRKIPRTEPWEEYHYIVIYYYYYYLFAKKLFALNDVKIIKRNADEIASANHIVEANQ